MATRPTKTRERERKKSNNASNLNIIDHTVVCGNIGISDCITFKREYRQNFSKKLREKYACEKKLKSRQKYKNVDNSQVDRLKSRLQLISLDGWLAGRFFFFVGCWSIVVIYCMLLYQIQSITVCIVISLTKKSAHSCFSSGHIRNNFQHHQINSLRNAQMPNI